MRNILNISVPPDTVKWVKAEVKSGGFSSVSEFFRHVLRLWKAERLATRLKEAERAFDNGQGVELKSFSDLD